MFKEKICISRIDKMGDMLLTLPIIKSIKIQIPNSEIHVLASTQNAKVLKNIKYIDKIIIIETNIKSFFKELNQLKKTKYKYFFNFSPNIKGFFLCFFSNSYKKSSIVFLSRYRKYFSKFLIRLLAFIICDHIHVVNRVKRLKNNQELHQTLMMFNLIEKCGLDKQSKNISIDMSLPSEKISFFRKKTVVVHASKRWINAYYSEKNFLELLSSLKHSGYLIIITTDYSTKNNFFQIYNNFKLISNSDFKNLKLIKYDIIILDNLEYESWVKVIYSSSLVISPECGCIHIAAACNVPVNIIYDANYFPEAMHKEYHPWKSKYNKFIFNEKNLNQKLIESLE